MAILSESEFEAVLNRMVRRIDKVLYQRRSAPKLEDARRKLQDLYERMTEGHGIELSDEEKQRLQHASETVRAANLGDKTLTNDSFDVEDYVHYRM